MTFFDSGHLQLERERPGLERKYINTAVTRPSEEPELATLISEVGGGTNVQSKQAHVLQH